MLAALFQAFAEMGISVWFRSVSPLLLALQRSQSPSEEDRRGPWRGTGVMFPGRGDLPGILSSSSGRPGPVVMDVSPPLSTRSTC